MEPCSFRRQHYRETLEMALAAGYRCMSVAEYLAHTPGPQDRILILRHDIDGPLLPELELSRVERALGVHSTFFLRVHAALYNAFSLDTLKGIKEIAASGSEIGLHYEPAFSDITGTSHLEGLIRDRVILEKGLGISVQGFTPHEPERLGALSFKAQDVTAAGFSYQGYDDRLIKNCKYISDSGCRWREGCFCQWIGKAPRLYVLTHGIWWYEQTSLENY